MQVLLPSASGISHGLLSIYSAPKALCNHIDWTISEVLGVPIRADWKVQRLQPGNFRFELAWQAKRGVAARLASQLAGWKFLRFEVTQAAASGSDGELYRFTPDLKMHFSVISEAGDILINEHQISSAIANCREPALLAEKMNEILGTPWERELEPFRVAVHETEFNCVENL